MQSTCSWMLAGMLSCAAMAGLGSAASAAEYATSDPPHLTQFISPDFFMAIVVHPTRIADSPLRAKMPVAQVLAMFTGNSVSLEGVKVAEKVDPKLVHRVVVLVEPPAQGVSLPPAVILQLKTDVDTAGIVSRILDDVEVTTIEGKKCFTSKQAGTEGLPMAVHVAGPRTVVLGLEPTVKKMLAPNDSPRPLLNQLKQANLKNDIIVEMVVSGAKSANDQATDKLTSGLLSPAAMLPKEMMEDVKSISQTVNFSGDKFIQMTLVGAKRDSAAKLAAGFNVLQQSVAFLNVPQSKAAKGKTGEPAATAGDSMMAISTQLIKGLKVTRKDNRVTLSVKMPRDLPALMESMAAATPPAGAPPSMGGPAMPRVMPTIPGPGAKP